MAYRKTERELQRLQERRERILDSACVLVQREGFGGVKAREVAEAAGVSVGSLYSHFGNVEALHAETFRVLAGREFGRVIAHVHTAGSATAALAALVRGFGARSLAAPRLAWALLLEPVTSTVEYLRLDFRRDYTALAAGIIQDGVDSREFTDQRVDVSAPALIGAIAESLVRPLAPAADSGPGERDARAEQHEFIEEILRVSLRAVGAATEREPRRNSPGRDGQK
ncbi:MULTISPECIES: TetR/AcrR family transcriptional regulator [Streptomyces]|uniref:TetR/AcrR family transcriptional regulator n=1 Tax=Streptomyces TaxID=1883 RepID=UPI00130086B1|nr:MULTISPECIES: TetR/AcrR family transcriptional regulator [Streptomyces]